MMDDGEVVLSEHVLLAQPDSSGDFQNSSSVDFLDEFLKNSRTCTHTHTCNPPGPDAAHTHTCSHTHTQVFPPDENDTHMIKIASPKPKRPLGNREAVRKYREKKKAHTAYLEEEVKKLRALNQQLVRKLQGQAVLEAEVMRLRSLLLDIRGKIDNELGVFPFQKHCSPMNNNQKEGEDCEIQTVGGIIGLRCHTDSPCFHPSLGLSSQVNISESEKLLASWTENCQPALIDCQVKGNEIMNGDSMDRMDSQTPTLISSVSQVEQ